MGVCYKIYIYKISVYKLWKKNFIYFDQKEQLRNSQNHFMFAVDNWGWNELVAVVAGLFDSSFCTA